MAETVKKHDFVELDYTGKLIDGTVFDTTQESVAKQNHFHSHNTKYVPAAVCVGEMQLLPGLDEALEGKELGKEYTTTLPPEKAFGKRDIKKMKIIPSNQFREHKMEPQPGLQIDVDGDLGTITRVSGGRVIVNFNHPLSGKEIVYSYKILRIITDPKEQIPVFFNASLKIPKEQIKVEIIENKATVTLPMKFPSELEQILTKKLTEVTKLKEVVLKAEEKKK